MFSHNEFHSDFVAVLADYVLGLLYLEFIFNFALWSCMKQTGLQLYLHLFYSVGVANNPNLCCHNAPYFRGWHSCIVYGTLSSNIISQTGCLFPSFSRFFQTNYGQAVLILSVTVISELIPSNCGFLKVFSTPYQNHSLKTRLHAFLNFGARWGSRKLYPWGKRPRYSLKKRLGGPRNRPGQCGEKCLARK